MVERPPACYHRPRDMAMSDRRIFVVCGPSGVGKTTLVRRLVGGLPGLGFSVSWTTRPPRGEDAEGVSYYFRTAEQFEQAVALGHFLEHATVHEQFYGTPWSELTRLHGAGLEAVLDIDVQGVRQVQALNLPAAYVFIAPPNLETLEARIWGRGVNAREEVELRLATARAEVAQSYCCDYLVINDDLDTAYDQLRAIVVAERCRVRHG